jgi:SRSO17 transposase
MAHTPDARERRFRQYVERLADALGHADRREPLRAYLTGLCLAGDRKSVEPMAARVDPRHVSARHQSMHHFVASAPWEATAVLRVARDWVLEPMARHGPVAAWIVDDTAYPKKGQHSVGVARQYCGVLGKQENCQVAVSVSLANAAVSLPVAYRLYLPESWAQDRRRRRAAGVPDDLEFQPKWQLALAQIRTLQAEGVPPAPVVADAGYGDTTPFREALTAAGLAYVVGVKGETTVWRPGQAPLPPKPWQGRRGRPSIRVRRTARHQPVSLKHLAAELPPAAWQTVTWREGTRGTIRSRFARRRVRPAHRDEQRSDPRPEEWLVMEWPRGESAPTKYWLSTLPARMPITELVRLAKLRWRIERDYQELKDELGLDHFEGRGWRGFHHHGALCIAAYAFLAAERATLSPPEPLSFLQPARLPKGFTPRGAPGAA